MIFEIRPGAAESPVILHVPHAARAMTEEAVDSLLITAGELTEELDNLTDAHTDVIAAQAAQAAPIRPWIFENRWSRLVVDPERFLGETEEMETVGMGAVYTHGFARRRLRDDAFVRAEAALRTHYWPYAHALATLVADRINTTGRAVILDVHSYPTTALPYELHGTDPRPPVCLGTDSFHTPPELIEAATEAFGDVALNTPFAGCYVPSDRWQTDPRVTSLMIEIRRDGYMTEPGGPPHGGLPHLAASLTTLITAATPTS
ncbi:N-formylglutamate amidohydrolase [Paractinoplanes durhamensis]|uniref:N-formylglutamate amidohydrolase n=1 Tax=Paractinoplanes durhamensis TaxID=113563 RepID=A0ABQ3Z4Y4_9ACTN|nr:N-formylglutamate amidohydrolase [Actinoplanes durhamensis]GIE04903.1 hypothetical protein Adu01nite_62530 [Actinoplanes durhamensis]